MHAIHARRRGGLLLLLSLIGAACRLPVGGSAAAPRSVQPGEVAFEYAGAGDAAVVVPVRINGKGPYRLVVDTGATLTCLDLPLAGELGLKRASGIRGFGAGVGGPGAVGIVSIDTLEVGSARASGLLACTLDLTSLRTVAKDVRGLLGLNFMKEYRLELDFERQTLGLHDPDAASPAAGAKASAP